VETISNKIFQTYDIRGRYPKDINADVSWRLGYFLPLLLEQEKIINKKRMKIVVGRDARLSGLILIKNFIRGLVQNNVEVVDAGVITTPMLYFIIKKFNFDLGIIITASHLNQNYTGFKIFNNDLETLGGEYLSKYPDFFNQPIVIKFAKGKILRKNFDGEYLNFLFKQIDIQKNFSMSSKIKILICCPKALGLILEKIKKQLKLNLQFVHRPIAKRLILKRGIDLMVQFDDDGDRVYFFDKQGQQFLGDYVGALFLEFVKNFLPKKIILDFRCGSFLTELAKKYYFQVIFSPAGHSYFKNAMRQNKALLGIEKSGHYYWKKFFYADAGLFSFLTVLKIISLKGQSLEDLLKKFEKNIVLPEMNFSIKDKNKIPAILKKIEKYFSKKGKITKIDGLTVKGKGFRFNIRHSHTEPNVIRLNIEAESNDILQIQLKQLKKLLASQ